MCTNLRLAFEGGRIFLPFFLPELYRARLFSTFLYEVDESSASRQLVRIYVLFSARSSRKVHHLELSSRYGRRRRWGSPSAAGHCSGTSMFPFYPNSDLVSCHIIDVSASILHYVCSCLFFSTPHVSCMAPRLSLSWIAHVPLCSRDVLRCVGIAITSIGALPCDQPNCTALLNCLSPFICATLSPLLWAGICEFVHVLTLSLSHTHSLTHARSLTRLLWAIRNAMKSCTMPMHEIGPPWSLTAIGSLDDPILFSSA